ncbi:hypothetical protein RJ55_03898 [Drechmeria coniospora]|nr:hypothetical protein RJ55_03898 [Drechmeria coniospora]
MGAKSVGGATATAAVGERNRRYQRLMATGEWTRAEGTRESWDRLARATGYQLPATRAPRRRVTNEVVLGGAHRDHGDGDGAGWAPDIWPAFRAAWQLLCVHRRPPPTFAVSRPLTGRTSERESRRDASGGAENGVLMCTVSRTRTWSACSAMLRH